MMIMFILSDKYLPVFNFAVKGNVSFRLCNCKAIDVDHV